MSDKLPFEDAFERKMNDLPARNEGASWQKMKALLEEKDKRKPFAWINIYTVCSCLIITALFGIWIMLSYENKAKQKFAATSINNKPDMRLLKRKGNETNPIIYPHIDNNTSTVKNTRSRLDSTDKNSFLKTGKRSLKVVASLYKSHQYNTSGYNNIGHRNNSNTESSAAKMIARNVYNQTADSLQIDQSKNKITETTLPGKGIIKSALQQKAGNVTDATNAFDTISKKNLLQNNDTTSVAKQIKVYAKNNKQYFIDAGLQLNQSLPFNGEKISLYNYNGNKNLLYDYIPSAYIKLEKNKHWFVQAEFAYLTPQTIKPFSFSRKTKADYVMSTVTTLNNYLQKTYYTQIPLSLNFYIKPNLFVGIGATYSWFYGAVTQQQTVVNNFKADSQSVTNRIVPVKSFTDSFLYKSQASLLVQTGYNWKKWGFSLRYTKAFQPFISYTLPIGTIDNKMNSSFQLLIKYSLFKSKEFNFKLKNKHRL